MTGPAAPPAPAPPPRSLGDSLRARGPGELVELLLARPDLAVPVPPDLATLAARATARASVARALDRLDAPRLQVVEVLAVLAGLDEPATAEHVSRLWGADAAAPLADLEALALVWRTADGAGTPVHRLVRVAAELLGPFPAGLGPPLAEALDRRSPVALAELGARLGLEPSGDPDTTVRRIAGVLRDPGRVAELLAGGPPDARRVLARLTWGPPVGAAPPPGGATASAVAWLLRHGLLAAADDARLVLPREPALALRGGRLHAAAPAPAPGVATAAHQPATVDRAAAGTAGETVRLVAQLLASLDRQRVPALRSGGLGVRELRRLAGELGVDEAAAARVAEAALAAGLLAEDPDAAPAFVVTADGDDWAEADAPQQWADLAAAWLDGTRVAGLAGGRDSAGTVRAALSDALERPASRELRRQVLDLAAALAPGEATDAAALAARLDHDAPRRGGPARDALVADLLDDMAWLGIAAFGAVAAHGRALAADGPGAATAALRGLLPEPVDHLVLQADLTAVAPGPLVPALAREMELAADVESRGAATVYRFSADSVRRALDAGRDAGALLETLERASTSGVPQPLDYLVRDVARRHGAVRVGAAVTYVRSDDEVALSELLADRRTAGLGLRRLAPTVLLSDADPAALLRALRAAGSAPVLDGAAPAAARPARRIRASRRGEPGTPAPDALRGAAAAWLAADAGPRPGSSGLPRMEPAVSLGVLRDAVGTGSRVWIGYVDETGRATQRLVVPLGLEAGRLTAEEVGRAGSRLFSVHRVTGAVPESLPD